MIAIIGGTGIYDPEMFKNPETKSVNTPYGQPSDKITIGEFQNRKIAFLPRHGASHSIPPHSINYRANLHALKQLGVTRIISPCAVGSLKEDYRPGEMAIVDQFIDFTKKRDYTYHDKDRVYHVSTADPFCPELREILAKSAKKTGTPFKKTGTYVCIEGPRFSTRAESEMFRQFADVIGMTLVPEVTLAREQEICYASLATVTDYDVWADKPVSIERVLKVMKENNENIKKVLADAIARIPEERNCECKDAMKNAGV